MDDLSYKIPALIERLRSRLPIVALYLASAIALIVVGHVTA